MRINNISYYNITQPVQKQNHKNNTTKNVNFEAIPIQLRRPKFKDPHVEKVYNQVLKLYELAGIGGEIKKVQFKDIDGKKYGIYCNRKNPKQQQVTIKNNVSNQDEWNKPQEKQTVINLYFNENGYLDNGTLTRPERNGYFRNANFRRNGRCHRSIQIEGLTYHPTKNNETIWSSVPSLSYYGVSQDVDIIEKFKDIELSELFFEFTKSHKSILPILKD